MILGQARHPIEFAKIDVMEESFKSKMPALSRKVISSKQKGAVVDVTKFAGKVLHLLHHHPQHVQHPAHAASAAPRQAGNVLEAPSKK